MDEPRINAGQMSDGGEAAADQEPSGPEAVTVYWRPGCFFCSRLLRGLEREGVIVALRNIWEDDEALATVRAHNGGDETVPTVMVGALSWTNPDTGTVTDAVRRSYPHLVAATRPGRAGRRPRLLGRA